MKEPPSATFALLLEDLYTVPGEFIACFEWRRIPNDRARRDIQTRRRHFFNKRISLINCVAPDTRPEEMLTDPSADETVAGLGNALTEIEVNGHFFGECSLTLVLFDADPTKRSVPDHELGALYARAGAFAFLSDYEGFGFTPLEALAAGVPIVVLDTPVAHEVYGNAAIYVDRPDPALIEVALEQAMFHDDARARVLDAAGEVLVRYSWRESARRTLQALVTSSGVPGRR